MALSIPIITEYVGTGLDKFKQELSQAETNSQKAGIAIKKAFLPATAVLGAMAVALVDATKGAIEDQQAQVILAKQLRTSTDATDKQIAAVEDWISTQGKLFGVTDDQLRPSLGKLIRATEDVERAQQLAAIGMDISAATGKDLESVTTALAKAEMGQFTALRKLGVPLGDNTQALIDMAKQAKIVEKAEIALNGALESGDKKEIQRATEKLTEAQERFNAVNVEGADFAEDLANVFSGAASESANTAAGQFQRLTVAFNETKESIGAALLPVVEAVLPYVQRFGQWAQDNPGAFIAVAGAIAAVAGAIVAVNIAMALNPFALIAGGIVALVAGLIVAYHKFEWFKSIVDLVFNGLKWYVGMAKEQFLALVGVFKAVFNGLASAWNNTIGKFNFTVPNWVPGLGGKGFDMPNIPMLADGGIVTGPTLALIGEAGPEAVVPLDRYNGGGGTNVTINVNGGDPQAVVNALRTYMRQNGSVPIRVSNIF